MGLSGLLKESACSLNKVASVAGPTDANGLDFMRIHKSYIINLRHIMEINKSRVVLGDGVEVPIGDSYREKLNAYIAQKFLGKV